MRSLALLAFVFPLFAQPDIIGTINGGQTLPAIAVPDLNGSGPAQSYMAAFNATLAADLEDSSSLQVRSKSLYPKSNPHSRRTYGRPIGPLRRFRRRTFRLAMARCRPISLSSAAT
jgi:hypothetical protein